MNDKNYDFLLKTRKIFNMPNFAYFKFYNASEHLEIDRVIIFWKAGQWSNSTSQKTQTFHNNIYITWGTTGSSYNMKIYLQKDSLHATPDMTTILQWNRWKEA
jgi:hypothetical protein